MRQAAGYRIVCANRRLWNQARATSVHSSADVALCRCGELKEIVSALETSFEAIQQYSQRSSYLAIKRFSPPACTWPYGTFGYFASSKNRRPGIIMRFCYAPMTRWIYEKKVCAVLQAMSVC